MSGADFSLSVDDARATAVVTVSGELDANTARDLEEHLVRVGGDHDAVVLDLTGVTFVDSVALASLSAAADRVVDLRVVGSRQVARMIALAGMDSEIALHDSVADATRGHLPRRPSHPAHDGGRAFAVVGTA